jgi:serine/threonine-protein kinase HipA
MRLAMFAGSNRRYVVDRIRGRHFMQTAERAGLPSYLAKEALEEVLSRASAAKEELEKKLPRKFPEFLHCTIWDGIRGRLENMRA